jgi:hypothetical protein
MASERTWNAVPPTLLTANGTTTGLLQITDTAGFYYGMAALIKNNSIQQTVYIGLVVDSTHVWVRSSRGARDYNVDLSAYTVASGSALSAAVQEKSAVPMEARLLATYETDPVDAWRTIPVDSYGNHYTASNPLPIAFDGTVNIGDVHILGRSPANNELDVNADGSLNTIELAQLVPFEFNEIDLTNSVIGGQTVPTIVVYKLASATVATLTLTYDGSANLLSVVRT